MHDRPRGAGAPTGMEAARIDIEGPASVIRHPRPSWQWTPGARVLDAPMCLAAMALAVCCAWLPRPAAAAVGLPTDFMNEVLVSQLNTPTSLAFLPDGRALFTEQKTGYVRMVVNGHLAATDPEFVVPSVNTDGYERGLEGIAVDPGWPQRPYVYFHYTRLGGYFRIVRYTVTGDVADPLGGTLSFGAPLLLIDDITDSNPNHNAGCLRFGPDSCLYASLGEDENWCAAAD